MLQLVFGSVFLSLLHALLPNHWLPLLAIGHKEKWSTLEVTWIAFICALAHAFSTILIGFSLGFLGLKLSTDFSSFTKIIAPTAIVLLGIYFIYRHHRHHHFHIQGSAGTPNSKSTIVLTLTLAMFLSPCLEVEGYFLLAGSHGFWMVVMIAAVYFVFSVTGITLWSSWTYRKATSFNWHALEHRAGIITGATLIVTGIISFFIS